MHYGRNSQKLGPQIFKINKFMTPNVTISCGINKNPVMRSTYSFVKSTA